MGQRLVALSTADKDFQLVAAWDAPGHPRLDQDAGTLAGVGALGVPMTVAAGADVDVAIDFSTPDGAMAALDLCVREKIPLVIATTGMEREQQERIATAAKQSAILWAPSMSLAVNLAMKLTAVAAEALKDHPTGADVEIIERHHRFKEDSPSGTALKFGQIVAGDHGTDTKLGTAARVDPACVRTVRSVTTPSASATIPANTRSSSVCSARRLRSPSRPRIAIAMPTAR